jgi:hypothetical protein
VAIYLQIMARRRHESAACCYIALHPRYPQVASRSPGLSVELALTAMSAPASL